MRLRSSETKEEFLAALTHRPEVDGRRSRPDGARRTEWGSLLVKRLGTALRLPRRSVHRFYIDLRRHDLRAPIVSIEEFLD